MDRWIHDRLKYVRLVNAGTGAIKPQDIIRPIRIELEDGPAIILAAIHSTDPIGIIRLTT